jgi:hypothetical protein
MSSLLENLEVADLVEPMEPIIEFANDEPHKSIGRIKFREAESFSGNENGGSPKMGFPTINPAGNGKGRTQPNGGAWSKMIRGLRQLGRFHDKSQGVLGPGAFDRFDCRLDNDKARTFRILIEEIGVGFVFDLSPDALERRRIREHGGFADDIYNQSLIVVEEQPVHVGASLDLLDLATVGRR